MRRSSREIPARVCQPENPFGQARQPDDLANPPPHLRPRRRCRNVFTRHLGTRRGHGGAWGTQAWMDPVKGVADVLVVQRSNFPNSDASDVRREFQKTAATGVGEWQGQTVRLVRSCGETSNRHLFNPLRSRNVIGLKARNVTARVEGPGKRSLKSHRPVRAGQSASGF
jgi:hypothetical protein